MPSGPLHLLATHAANIAERPLTQAKVAPMKRISGIVDIALGVC